MSIKKIISSVLILVSTILVIVMSIRGLPQNPTEETINQPQWRDSGIFELSPERGRFALTYSIIENSSVFFSTELARFVVPDLGIKDGKYVSLFAPGVSYIIAPGYLVGKALGSSQVGTFAVISLFALSNAILISAIAKRLGASYIPAVLSGLIFLFATPGFTYAVDLYQHHISTFLILGSMYALLRWNNRFSLLVTWLLCAASIPIDYPNLFLMFPIGLWATFRLFNMEKSKFVYQIKFFPKKVLTLIAVIPPLLFFFWFNSAAYGNPFQFSGTVPSVSAIDEAGKPAAPKAADVKSAEYFLNPDAQNKSAVAFFNTRSLLNGFYIHSISPDRGTLFFAPIVLFGVAGILFAKKKYPQVISVFVAVIGANVLLYSMWGDPWGGWAFGSRYMIPTYAVLSIFIGTLLTKFSNSKALLLFVWIVLVYSLAVNTLGAITTSKNPPAVEVLGLEKLSGKVEHYSYDRNYEFLQNNNSKSIVFQSIARNHVSALNYYFILTGFLTLFLTVLLVSIPFTKNKQS